MKVVFRNSFLRDLKRISDPHLKRRVRQAIADVESASSVQQIKGLKRISGPSEFYRIRLGDYRIGLAKERQTIEFVRFLHRREIYRHFP